MGHEASGVVDLDRMLVCACPVSKPAAAGQSASDPERLSEEVAAATATRVGLIVHVDVHAVDLDVARGDRSRSPRETSSLRSRSASGVASAGAAKVQPVNVPAVISMFAVLATLAVNDALVHIDVVPVTS